MEYVTLNNGVQMPVLGYGTWQTPPYITEASVEMAIRAGYRLIDTAQCYGNELQVGNAVLRSGISRSDFFVTTKTYTNGYRQTRQSIKESLKKLKTGYIDLLLIHEPVSDNVGTYRALEDAYQAGDVRAIGLSNYYGNDLQEILSQCEIRPVINQIETHVFWQHKDIRQMLDKEQIQLESWAPFAEGKRDMFRNPILCKIGEKHGKSAAQIVLRFLIQENVVVIPKSLQQGHIEDNLDVFDFALDEDDVGSIRSMDMGQTLFFWP